MPTETLFDAADFGPPASSLTPEERKAQEDLRRAYMGQLGWGLGLSAAATAGQFGAMAFPTAQDSRNKEKLAELEAAHSKGKLAETPQAALIRQQYQQGVAKAGALGQQAQQQAATRLTAAGDSIPVAQRMAVEQAAARPSQEAALIAGQQRSAANLQEMGRQLEEAEGRTAYKAEKQKALLQMGAQTVGALAPLAGQVVAAQKVKAVDWGSLDLNPTEQLLYMRAFSSPGAAAPLQSLIRSTPETA